LIVHFDCFGRKRQEGSNLQPPFRVRISIDLIDQSFTGYPLNCTLARSSKDLLNRFGFFMDSNLGLVVGEAIQTAGIEVDFHMLLAMENAEVPKIAPPGLSARQPR
jgi:hypothetical protein